MIFISHRMAEVAALCDRATVLRDGVTVGVTDTAPGSEERIVSLMLGAEVAHDRCRRQHARRRRGGRGRRGAGARGARPALRPSAQRRLVQPCAPARFSASRRSKGRASRNCSTALPACAAATAARSSAHGRKLKLQPSRRRDRAQAWCWFPANRLQALLPQRSIRENVALAARPQPAPIGA